MHPSRTIGVGSLASAHGAGRGSQCLPQESKMAAVTCTHPSTSVDCVLFPGSTYRERSCYGGPTPLLMHFPVMVTCISGEPRLLPSTASVSTVQPLQAVSSPNPGPLPETDLWSLSFSTQPSLVLTEECLRLGSIGCWC